MSKQKCFGFLKDVPAKIFNGDTPQQVYEEIKSTFKDNANNKEELLKRLQDELLNRYDVEKFKRDKWMRTAKLQNAVAKVESFKNKKDGLISFISGVFGKETGRADSVAANSNSMKKRVLGDIVKQFKQEKLLDFFNGTRKNPADEIDLANALASRTVKNELARKAAKIINEHYEKLRVLQNRHGAEIKELQDFIASQHHDPEKMMRGGRGVGEMIAKRKQYWGEARAEGHSIVESAKIAGDKLYNESKETWKQDQLQRLNLERTFRAVVGNSTEVYTDEKMSKILDHIFGVITQGQLSKIAKDNVNLAKKIERNRVLHYKDGESWIENNNKYGSGNLADSVVQSLMGQANNYVLLNRMTDRPDEFYQGLKEQVRKNNKDNHRIVSQLNKGDKYYRNVMGYHAMPHDNLGAKIGKSIRASQYLFKLGNIIFSMFTDHVGAISTLRHNGFNLFDQWHKSFSHMLGPLDNKTRKEVGNLLGITAEQTLGMHAALFRAGDSPIGQMSRVQNLLSKLNFHQTFDNSLRSGVATALSHHLAKKANLTYERLPKLLKSTLNAYGYGEKEHALLQDNKESMRNIDHRMYATPDMFDTATDESMATYLDKDVSKLTDKDKEAVKEHMSQMLSTYLTDQTNTAQMSEGISEQAMLNRGLQSGTVAGEFARIMTQFKQYPLAITRRTIGRTIKEEGSTVGGLVQNMITATLLGYLANSGKQLWTNGQLPNPASSQGWINAISMGGGMGMFGDYMKGNYSEYGHSFSDNFIPPTFQSVNDVVKLAANLNPFNSHPKRMSYWGNAGKAMLNFANYNVFSGTWLTHNYVWKQFTNAIMDELDPGYIKSVAQEQAKQKDQYIQV